MGAKNTVDRVVDLCYNKTIESQERQGTERHEKWRAKKMIAFVFFGVVLIVMLTPFLVGAFFVFSCLSKAPFNL